MAPGRALFALLLALGACSRGEDGARHLLLVTVDTWRGDHASRAVVGTELTPQLDRFLERAVVFREAYSVGAETSPGVAAVLTGLFPHRSGVVDNSHTLPETVPTLARFLKDEGFRTAAWVANPVLREGHGFESGFESYELTRRKKDGRADRLLTRVGDWIEARETSERWFAWAHLMEPHGPYWAPEEDLELFPAERFGPRLEVPHLPEGDNSGAGGIPHYQWKRTDGSPTDAREYLSRYAAGVHWLDRALGDFFERLERAGRFDDTLVVLTSDHGEALVDDYGFWFCHSRGLTEDQVRVPLALWSPGAEARVESAPVSTVDVFPTALRALGLPVPEHTDGIDLLGDDASFVLGVGPEELALREGPWKLRVSRDGTVLELLELQANGAWRTRDADADSPHVRALRERMLARLQEPPLGRSRNRVTTQHDVDVLRDLGYTE